MLLLLRSLHLQPLAGDIIAVDFLSELINTEKKTIVYRSFLGKVFSNYIFSYYEKVSFFDKLYFVRINLKLGGLYCKKNLP